MRLEVVSLGLIFTIDPPLNVLISVLPNRGYLCASCIPRALGGYEVEFIKGRVFAIKSNSRLEYNFERKALVLTVYGELLNEITKILRENLNDIAEAFRLAGLSLEHNILYTELVCKTILELREGSNTGKVFPSVNNTLSDTVRELSETLGTELSVSGIDLIAARCSPFSLEVPWCHVMIRPVVYTAGTVSPKFELVIVYRARELSAVLRVIDKLNVVIECVLKILYHIAGK